MCMQGTCLYLRGREQKDGITTSWGVFLASLQLWGCKRMLTRSRSYSSWQIFATCGHCHSTPQIIHVVSWHFNIPVSHSHPCLCSVLFEISKAVAEFSSRVPVSALWWILNVGLYLNLSWRVWISYFCLQSSCFIIKEGHCYWVVLNWGLYWADQSALRLW